MSVFQLLKEVKESLRPNTDLVEHTQAILDRINDKLRKRDIQAKAVAGGSVAKQTFLAGDHDIDVFVRFSLEYSGVENELADILEKALSSFSPKRVHGSRDYFQFVLDGYDVEIVPVLAVEHASEAHNVTDMSPLHAVYFNMKNENQEDEVRLAKQFCKSAGVYGAESYIRGLSGHTLDLLILFYGSFYDLVKEAARWSAPVVIDLEKHHDNPVVAIDQVKHAPLLVVDPMQPERNAAAALSQEKYDLFVSRCKEFIKDPSVHFFTILDFDEEKLRKELDALPGVSIFVQATHPEEDKKDVAGARIRKAFERLQAEFIRAGFTLDEDGWHFVYGDESLFWFSVQEHSLPRLMEHEGPPLAAQIDAQRFRDTHDEVYEKDGKLYAKKERTITQPMQLPDVFAEEILENLQVTIALVD